MCEPEKPTEWLYQLIETNHESIEKIRAELKAASAQLAKLAKESETTDGAIKTTPTKAAGVQDHKWTIAELVEAWGEQAL